MPNRAYQLPTHSSITLNENTNVSANISIEIIKQNIAVQDDYGNESHEVLNNYLSLGNGSDEGIIFPSENKILVDIPCDINLINSNCVNNISTNQENDAYSILNTLKLNNINRILFAQLNINSIRNKIDMLSDLVANKIDILLISETKLDASFPSVNFLIPGFSKPYRRDRSSHAGGLLLYIREDIPLYI